MADFEAQTQIIRVNFFLQKCGSNTIVLQSLMLSVRIFTHFRVLLRCHNAVVRQQTDITREPAWSGSEGPPQHHTYRLGKVGHVTGGKHLARPSVTLKVSF